MSADFYEVDDDVWIIPDLVASINVWRTGPRGEEVCSGFTLRFVADAPDVDVSNTRRYSSPEKLIAWLNERRTGGAIVHA